MTPEENQQALEMAEDFEKLLTIATSNIKPLRVISADEDKAQGFLLYKDEYMTIATTLFIQLRRDRKCREEASAPSTDKQKAFIVDLIFQDKTGFPGDKNAKNPSHRETVKNEMLADSRSENLDQTTKAYASEIITRLQQVRVV